MSLADAMIPELTHEAANTRVALERIPAGRFGWKPHERSMAFGPLASHIAQIPGWIPMVFSQEELSMDPESFETFEASNETDLLERFDGSVRLALEALASADDESLLANWKMTSGGQVLVDMPRQAVIRSWVLNHLIHHRGQLTVYLRENGIPVPALYGPSADEEAW